MPTKRRGRDAWLATIPWVRRLEFPVPCDAWRTGIGPAAFDRWCANDPDTLVAWGCRQPGYWRFQALALSGCSSGIYCTGHLVHRGVYGDQLERARTDAWLAS